MKWPFWNGLNPTYQTHTMSDNIYNRYTLIHPMYFLQLSMPTVIQNFSIVYISCYFSCGLTSLLMYSFRSCCYISTGWRSRDGRSRDSARISYQTQFCTCWGMFVVHFPLWILLFSEKIATVNGRTIQWWNPYHGSFIFSSHMWIDVLYLNNILTQTCTYMYMYMHVDCFLTHWKGTINWNVYRNLRWRTCKSEGNSYILTYTNKQVQTINATESNYLYFTVKHWTPHTQWLFHKGTWYLLFKHSVPEIISGWFILFAVAEAHVCIN